MYVIIHYIKINKSLNIPFQPINQQHTSWTIQLSSISNDDEEDITTTHLLTEM